MTDAIDPSAVPSGEGCLECDGAGGWWVHLRRCATCGHIGCCDTSPSQHARRHHEQTGHTVITSFEPGEDWFYDFTTDEGLAGPELAPPHAHPVGQPVPGPAGRVPADWRSHLN
ncbi:ubiquitin carboxyl-terminal hydrolase family protein [Jatrophihabitans fulvus]